MGYIPETLETNVTWQAGHLIMSFYFHSTMVIKGHQKDIIHKIPLHEYDAIFTKASPTDCIGKTDPTEIIEQLTLVQKKSMEIITSLSENDLNTKLEPTKTAHPIAKNKYEALDWNIKHTMWHCGQ